MCGFMKPPLHIPSWMVDSQWTFHRPHLTRHPPSILGIIVFLALHCSTSILNLLIIIISKYSKTFCQQISSPSYVFILVIFSNTKLFLMWKVSFTYMIELYNYFGKSRLNYNHAYLLIYFLYLLWLNFI